MGIGGKVLRIGAVAVIVLALGSVVWLRTTEPGEGHFCTLGLAIVEVDGQEAQLQDQAKPGRDGCDLDDTQPRARVLGFDCKVRASNGDVVVELVPNRSDGTCGQGSIPSPWPTA